MAKKHLAAVSLLIVLIFGLTACVCRSSDTAISVPVYDKPASATANNRTMQDETATKSSSEKSSEATTESAQSEDASALIFLALSNLIYQNGTRCYLMPLLPHGIEHRMRTFASRKLGSMAHTKKPKKPLLCATCAIIFIMAAMVRNIIRTAALCRHQQKQCWKYLMICCIACPLNWCRMVLEPTCGQKSSVGL